MQMAETEEVITPESEDEPDELDTEAGKPAEEEDSDDPPEEEGVVVSIGEESPPQEEEQEHGANWLRELRKRDREKTRRIRELEEEKARLNAPPQGALKAKPTLEGCEFDPDRFERELESWHEQKRVVDAETRKKQDAAEAEKKAWQTRLEAYGKAKAELKVNDYEDAEAVAQEIFSQTQQGVIVTGADNSALLVYALGKNPKKAKELASINDPVKFAFAVAKLETQLKVSPRKAAPPPEGTVRGSARVVGAVDSQMARLEAEAEKTGDRTKIVAYRQKLKQASK